MIELIIFLTLLALGFFIGQHREKNHYKSIISREEKLSSLPAISTRHLPDDFHPCDTQLVAGNVVISIDYFKKFVAGLRIIIGGKVSTFETLVERARREALLRMKQEAAELGADCVFNIKMETSSISKGQGDTVGSVEVLAYGTAIIKR